MAKARGRYADDQSPRVERWVIEVLSAGLVAALSWWAWDVATYPAAVARARASWSDSRALIAARLHQPEPLEFGAVWRTRSGLTCGMVNGWGSFGGATGMTPFFVRGRKAIFGVEVGAVAFAPGWRVCVKDHHIRILDGTEQRGRCGTKLYLANHPPC